VKKTRQNKNLEPPFRFNRNGKGSGAKADMIVTSEIGSPAGLPAGVRPTAQRWLG